MIVWLTTRPFLDTTTIKTLHPRATFDQNNKKIGERITTREKRGKEEGRKARGEYVNRTVFDPCGCHKARVYNNVFIFLTIGNNREHICFLDTDLSITAAQVTASILARVSAEVIVRGVARNLPIEAVVSQVIDSSVAVWHKKVGTLAAVVFEVDVPLVLPLETKRARKIVPVRRHVLARAILCEGLGRAAEPFSGVKFGNAECTLQKGGSDEKLGGVEVHDEKSERD